MRAVKIVQLAQEHDGGASCPSLTESSSCGQANGGCDEVCLSDGSCACTTKGYELQGNDAINVLLCIKI